MTKVDAALALGEQSDRWLVELRPEEALEFVRRAGAYNAFAPEDLAELVQAINALVPPMKFAGANPNNGRPHHTFSVGNEGSRVVYLDVRKFYLKEGYQGKPFDYDGLAAALKELGTRANAVEFWTTKNDEHSFVYRFWWD